MSSRTLLLGALGALALSLSACSTAVQPEVVCPKPPASLLRKMPPELPPLIGTLPSTLPPLNLNMPNAQPGSQR